jgi:cyclophilin family peptidyl-prolyl cis-trans isomerase
MRHALCGLMTASLLAFIPLTAAQEKAVNPNELPQVLLKTTKGDVVIELYEDEAPNTVANFISLIEKKYYNGLTFHRVLDGFMAQGGCPKGTGTEGPGYAVPCECYQANARKHEKGVLSMAHAGRDTGGSQFFITFVATPHLDGKHTVFGKVIKGMENVEKLQRVDPGRRDPNIQPDKIEEATVIRKRDHKYEPKTLPSRR